MPNDGALMKGIVYAVCAFAIALILITQSPLSVQGYVSGKVVNPRVATLPVVVTNGPLIAYMDSSGAVNGYRCDDQYCTQFNRIRTIYQGINTPLDESVSAAIPSDNLPIITFRHRDSSGHHIRVAKCNDPRCMSAQSNDVFNYTDPYESWDTTRIVVPSDNRPVLLYVIEHSASSQQGLHITKCGDSSCSQNNITTNVVPWPIPPDGYYDLAIGSDNLPIVINRRGPSPQSIEVIKCDNADCTLRHSNLVPNNSVGVGVAQKLPSLAIAADGMPIFAYASGNARTLKIVKCTTLDCATHTTTTHGSIWDDISLQVPSDGIPALTYLFHDAVAGEVPLKRLRCSTIDCSGSTTETTIDPLSSGGNQLVGAASGTIRGVTPFSAYVLTTGVSPILFHLLTHTCQDITCSIINYTVLESPLQLRYSKVAVATR